MHPVESLLNASSAFKSVLSRKSGEKHMKITPMLCIVLTLCISMQGSIVESLNSINDGSVVGDKELIGKWALDDPSKADQTLEFNWAPYKLCDSRGCREVPDYALRMKLTSGDFVSCQATLIEINGHRFLSIFPHQHDATNGDYTLHFRQSKLGLDMEPGLVKLSAFSYLKFTPTAEDGEIHAKLVSAFAFYRIRIEGNDMMLDYIDDTKLKKLIEHGDISLPTSPVTDGEPGDRNQIVITASKEELRRFLSKHMDDETVFTEHVKLRKAPLRSSRRHGG
jgi:hypothetical protein